MNKKVMYKLELVCVKYTPIIISFFTITSILLSFIGIDISLYGNLLGASLLSTIPMYISSYVYRFCAYHRMFIHYLVIVHLIDICDRLFIIPVSDYNLLVLYLSITGICLFIILYLYLKYGDRRVNESNK